MIENTNESRGFSITRRTALKGIGASSAFAILGVPIASTPVAADEWLCEEPLTAGQHIDVGVVTVGDFGEGGDFDVQYELTNPDWVLLETHLHVAESLAELPTKKSGPNENPVPGQFDHASTHALDDGRTAVTHYDVVPRDWRTAYVAAHAVVWDTSACPDDVVLYATENNHPGDDSLDGTMAVRIHAIYPSAGTSETVETLTLAVDEADTDNFNGNAWDAENGRFYFSRYEREGGDPSSPLPSELFFAELDGTVTSAGVLEGGCASGTIYDGDYYYVKQRTDDLMRVTLAADGTIVTETKVADVLAGTPYANQVLGFGDVAIKDGTLYSSATRIGGGYTVVFFEYDLDTGTYTEITTGDLYGAGGTQLAFGADGVLYGVNARPNAQGEFPVFTIDPSTGDTTKVGDLDEPMADLASGPTCAADETAWGGTEKFNEDGKGSWATYFTCRSEA